jgi:pyruvate,water dikinase
MKKKAVTGLLKSLFRLPGTGKREVLPFKVIFDRFRDVLESNGRAIELISDMGEKLGGGYLFDINYIRSAYASLSSAVRDSVNNLGALTQNRYPALHGTFGGIDTRIMQMLDDTSSGLGEMVLFYDRITWDQSRDVGGKNAHLAELRNSLGINVPRGFAVTTHAFDVFMEQSGLREKLRDLARYDQMPHAELEGLGDRVIRSEMPPLLSVEIGKAVEEVRRECGSDSFLAVRSSADDEDGDFSFAGQFRTVLNVPLNGDAVADAYKKVIASLFSSKALAYRKRLGYSINDMKMAVGCMVMVDAAASGVLYTARNGGDRGTMIINAAWGLGESVVEGQTDADLYEVKKYPAPEIVRMKTGKKEVMIVARQEGGTEKVETPAGEAGKPCLSPEQALELADVAVRIEGYFRRPQDIEWAIDRNGRIFILQARPLRSEEEPRGGEATGKGEVAVGAPGSDTVHVQHRPVIKDRGMVVQKGIGAGRVFLVKRMEDLDHFPKGAVLVSRHDSSNFVRIMPFASAIITDIGTPTSHMASLSREFRVPTVVNAGNATDLLKHGEEVTVDAGEEHEIAVYSGIVRELLENSGATAANMEELFEFRKKRYILRFITALNLVDPLKDSFTPEGCRSMHDVIRFVHEKAVWELVERAREGNATMKKHAATRLDLPVPAGIMVIDIGEGLKREGTGGTVTLGEIASVPLRAIAGGMVHPGAWHSGAISVKATDFLTSMMRATDIISDSGQFIENNIAVVSKEYMNLSIRFGYHFTMVDSYCSENTRNNHIYFRFVGGATDIAKRSRRVQFIGKVLGEYGFNIKMKGDLILARIANVRQDEMVTLLDQLGRLIAYTRQLDAVLHDDESVERYARNFFEQRYEI